MNYIWYSKFALVCVALMTVGCSANSVSVLDESDTYLIKVAASGQARDALLAPKKKDALNMKAKDEDVEVLFSVPASQREKTDAQRKLIAGAVQNDLWLAWSPGNKNALVRADPKDSVRKPKEVWDDAYKNAEIFYKKQAAQINKAGLTGNVNVIQFEPNIAHYDSKLHERYEEKEKENTESKSTSVGLAKLAKGNEFEVIYEASEIWGSGAPGWHLDDNHSQVAKARETLKKHINSTGLKDDKRVLLAHLDTGFYFNDALLLKNRSGGAWPYGTFLEGQSHNFYKNKCKSDKKYPLSSARIARGECPGHGAETLSGISGSELKLPNGEFEGVLGGNPYANVLEYRIGSNPIHLFPKEMAEAINAAVDNGADVVALSAGGLPSAAQRDAVNKAYEKGTAIVAATGDYYKAPFFNVWSPKLVGFPARFNRVMGVAGTTYDHRSYGEDPCSEWSCILPKVFSPGIWTSEFWSGVGSWTLRGNYGPYEIMNGGHVVSAYAPNVLKSESYEIQDGNYARFASKNGAGTSHSTPQVAAAASIWLQLERPELERRGMWRSWQKSEAVYQAISTCSADKKTLHPDVKAEFNGDQEKVDEYFTNHFGAGHLKANNALQYKFDPTNLTKRPKSKIGFMWLSDLLQATNLGILEPSQKILASLYASMMVLETSQAVFAEKQLNKAFASVRTCIAINNLEGTCKKEVRDFLLELQSHPRISSMLVKTLKKLTQNEKFDENFPQLAKELRAALKESDPNRCELKRLADANGALFAQD